MLSNGRFASGVEGWSGGTAVAGNIVSYFAVTETSSGNVYDVNLSQSMTLVPDSTYTITFKAKSSIDRTMIAGLGLYHDPWTNSGESVDLTTEWQEFTLVQTTTVDGTGYGDDDSRVLFDMGGDQGGQVWIDDVSVVDADGTELVTNGSFASGTEGWAGGAAADANIVSYFAVVETTSANVYDVNLSYVMALTTDTEYTVSFKAKSSISRTITAGLGLNEGPWTNVAESVDLTTDWQEFTLVQTTSFGSDNSRMIFDMGGDQGGQVWIDDVSVMGPVENAGPVDPEAGDIGTGDNNVLDAGEVINFNSTTADIYTLEDFGNNVSTLVADPTDATNTVVSIIKGSETWAGTTIAKGSVVYPLTATETGITVRVWSPEAGITVRLKLEESTDNTHTVETDALTTKAQEWETLTFDFSKPAEGTADLNTDYVFDTLSIFMNFGSAGSSETYYFDDVTFIGVVPVPAPTVAAADLVGNWSFAPVAGAMAVGESAENLGWWSSNEEDVTTRACIFDDVFTFGADGSFSQTMGAETWVEGWQGNDPEGCATPVAPHDGSYTDGTFTVTDSKVTVNGLGAHLGLAKVNNGGELSSSADAVSAITYNVTELADDGNSLTLQIQYNGANTWQFKFVKSS